MASYVYDALGRRIKATESGTTTITLYLGNDIVYEADCEYVTKYIVAGGKYLARIVTEAQPGSPGVPQAEYEKPPDNPSGPTNPGGTSSLVQPPPPPDQQAIVIQPVPMVLCGTFYLHTDLVGSIRAVTDSSGEVVARYDYEPFGLTARAEGTLAGRDVHKFTGKPEDTGTGLHYFGARFYDPGVGRFTSRDPVEGSIEVPLTWNAYIYVLANPLRYVDSTGCYIVEEFDEYGDPLVITDYGTLGTDSWRVELELQANVAWAEGHRSPAGLLEWVLFMVWPHGEWDYKNDPKWQGREYYWRGLWLSAEALGNLNFGVTAAALGLPLGITLAGNRAANLAFGGSTASPPGSPAGGDDPRDVSYVVAGHAYYREVIQRAKSFDYVLEVISAFDSKMEAYYGYMALEGRLFIAPSLR